MRITVSENAWKTLGLEDPDAVPSGLKVVASGPGWVTFDADEEAMRQLRDSAAELRTALHKRGRAKLAGCFEMIQAVDAARGGSPPRIPPLSAVLPPGEEAAKEYINRLMDRVAEHREQFHFDPEALRRWFLTLLSAEYEAERFRELDEDDAHE